MNTFTHCLGNKFTISELEVWEIMMNAKDISSSEIITNASEYNEGNKSVKKKHFKDIPLNKRIKWV